MATVVQRTRDWWRELRGKTAGPPDKWQVLVKRYSGWRLVLHLLFASIFFLPLLIRLLILSGVMPGSTESELENLQGVLDQDVSLWELLIFGFLGTKSLIGWLSVGLTAALLVYNVLRVLLTLRIAWMRRHDVPHTPEKYGWMYRIHMPWMYVLVTLSLGYAAVRIYDSFNVNTLLPGL